jgi:polar amino acid transport system substrate-binding protein
MRRHTITLAGLVMAGALGLAGCSGSDSGSSSNADVEYITTCAASQSSGDSGTSTAEISDPASRGSDYTIAAGKLTVCSDVPYPPFEDFDDGSELGFTGFDIDMANEIASRLGLTLQVLDSDFDALQSGVVLAAGQCDMGTSAMTITEERKANIDFADPYYDSLQSLLVRKDSGYAKLSDLAGKTIGVQSGTTGKNYAEKNAPSDATLLDLPSDGDLWPAIQAGQIDAILQDCPVNMEHAINDDTYGVIEKWETDEQYGFAFAKDQHVQLREDVNAALAAMRADGTYDTIYHKYFD